MQSLATFVQDNRDASERLVHEIDRAQDNAIGTLESIISRAKQALDALNGDSDAAWNQVLHDDNVVGASGTIGTLFSKYEREAARLVVLVQSTH